MTNNFPFLFYKNKQSKTNTPPSYPPPRRGVVFPRRRILPSFEILSSPPSGAFFFSFLSSSQQLASDAALLENVQTESEGEIDAVSDSTASEDLNSEVTKTKSAPPPLQPPPPCLSVKEKKELASYAHSLGKKLKSQQVGKSGVTDTVIGALIETLEANELLKLKIHGTCPGEFEDVMKQLEESTGSVVVGQIGRTVILYSPSLSKLKAEEKKKQFQRDFSKRQAAFKQFPQVHYKDEGRRQGKYRDKVVLVGEEVAEDELYIGVIFVLLLM